MKFFIVAFVLALALLNEASAQAPFNGTCEGSCTAPGFTGNINDFLGIWYLQQLTPNTASAKVKCSYTNYTSVDGNTLVGSLNYITIAGNQRVSVPANVTIFPNGTVTYSYSDLGFATQHQLVSSSPDYLAAFLCTECGFYSTDGAGLYGSIYTRLVQPPCDHTDTPLLDLSNCGIPSDILERHNQWDCQLC